jgi:hypothetical protein
MTYANEQRLYGRDHAGGRELIFTKFKIDEGGLRVNATVRISTHFACHP